MKKIRKQEVVIFYTSHNISLAAPYPLVLPFKQPHISHVHFLQTSDDEESQLLPDSCVRSALLTLADLLRWAGLTEGVNNLWLKGDKVALQRVASRTLRSPWDFEAQMMVLNI